MLELTIRLIASLAVVVGLLLLLVRLAGRRFAGRPGALVQVLHRQPLSRTSSVTVLTVGQRVLVVGTTEHQVSLLTELDPDELESEETLAALEPAEAPAPAAPAPAADVPAVAGSGALTGSVLSPETWRQALAAVTGRAS